MLKLAARIRGRVLVSPAFAVSRVGLVESEPTRWRTWRELGVLDWPEALVARDGSFEFDVVPPDVELRVVSLTPGCELAYAGGAAKAGSVLALEPIEVKERKFIVVECVGTTGNPLSGVRATSNPRESNVSRGKWKIDGSLERPKAWTRFVAPAVSDVNGVVEVPTSANAGEIWLDGDFLEAPKVGFDLSKGSHRMRVVLDASRRELRGRLLAEGGERIMYGTVVVRDAEDRLAAEASADVKGNFFLRAVRGRGPWTVSATSDARSSETPIVLNAIPDHLEIPMGSVVDVQWRVEAVGAGQMSVRYVVEREIGTPPKRETFIRGVANEVDRCHLNLSDGRYWITVSAEGFVPEVRGPIEVKRSEARSVAVGTIRLETATAKR